MIKRGAVSNLLFGLVFGLLLSLGGIITLPGAEAACCMYLHSTCLGDGGAANLGHMCNDPSLQASITDTYPMGTCQGSAGPCVSPLPYNGAVCSSDSQCQSRCCRSGTCGETLYFYQDADRDGKTGMTRTSTPACRVSGQYWAARQDNDCDDRDNSIYPGAPDLCDSKDNNCDGTVDNGCAQPNRVPSISSVSFNGRIAGQPTTISVQASDPDGDLLQFTYQFEHMQEGARSTVSIVTSSSSRAFTWVAPGTYPVSVSANDPPGGTASWSGSVTIESAGVCSEGQTKCITSGSGTTPGTVQTCSSGRWGTTQSCGFKPSCWISGGSYYCQQTAKLCENNQCQTPSDSDQQSNSRSIFTYCGYYVSSGQTNCKTSCTSNADCVAWAQCRRSSCISEESNCDDGSDNNRDGTIDCLDPTCNQRSCGIGAICQNSACRKLDKQQCASTAECIIGRECKSAWPGSEKFCVAASSCAFSDLYDSGRASPASIGNLGYRCAKRADTSKNDFGTCTNGVWDIGSCSAGEICTDNEPRCRRSSQQCRPEACSGYVNNCDSTGNNGCSSCTRTNSDYNMCGLNQPVSCGSEGSCDDGLDNDCDGNADCADSDCTDDCRNIDTDGDGLTDYRERQAGTNINLRDTDGDGLNDGLEVDTYYTNPLDSDTDDDGVSDGEEVRRGTDPTDTNNWNPQTENCNDRIDNDEDSRIDCQDADCPSTAGTCFLPTCSPTTFQWTAVSRCAGTRESCGCLSCENVNNIPGTVSFCDPNDLTKTFRTDRRGFCENNVIRYSPFRASTNCASNERCRDGACVPVVTDARQSLQYDTDGDGTPDATDRGPNGADYSRDADNDGVMDGRFGGSDSYICVKSRQTECCDLQGSVDEDCDGEINEGCDRDRDGWIDANAEVCQ